MKIKGLEKLTNEQRRLMYAINKRHVAGVGSDYKEGMQITETWLNEKGVLCVRLKNGDWYHYTNKGAWY